VAAHSSNDRAIDPRPYEIRLAQAIAQLETASARFELAKRELWRAQELKRTDFGTMQNVDQRAADLQAAQASVDDAKAQIRDAQFDLLALPHHGPLHRRRLESKKADLPLLPCCSLSAPFPTWPLSTKDSDRRFDGDAADAGPPHLSADRSAEDLRQLERRRDP
jgi:hypothetical protein